ncbi:hypothetical protein EWM64_g1494 [Hericium alpestre]|uniref:Uncharacterized protein n=1 Tax=Hericium alpestre TaxID=135208 RepID=A0A4Z0A7Q6_9AGAM|nr:hypothetical protein EWM64_g1494 [Hericium alpestre]
MAKSKSIQPAKTQKKIPPIVGGTSKENVGGDEGAGDEDVQGGVGRKRPKPRPVKKGHGGSLTERGEGAGEGVGKKGGGTPKLTAKGADDDPGETSESEEPESKAPPRRKKVREVIEETTESEEAEEGDEEGEDSEEGVEVEVERKGKGKGKGNRKGKGNARGNAKGNAKGNGKGNGKGKGKETTDDDGKVKTYKDGKGQMRYDVGGGAEVHLGDEHARQVEMDIRANTARLGYGWVVLNDELRGKLDKNAPLHLRWGDYNPRELVPTVEGGIEHAAQGARRSRILIAKIAATESLGSL